ncbi:MAG: hypothetical protein DRK00_07060 [Thermoprotei archaeon]|nr:MAG: hypothetical protein DRK00_07060 [Thermoprotei archaeon]
MILRPAEPRIQVKQVILDECEEEHYSRLKEGGKYVDELVILPDESVIVVEHAKWPRARDGEQALESLRNPRDGDEGDCSSRSGEGGFR